MVAIADDIYQIAIPVAGQDEEERNAAAAAGMQELLLRLTASTESLARDDLKPLWQQAEGYIQRYDYQALKQPAQAQFAAREDDNNTALPAQQLLVLQYAQEPIEAMLRNLGVSFWGSARPPILIWLARLERNGQGRLLSIPESPDSYRILHRQARQFGLPLIYPQIDNIDRQALPIVAIVQADSRPIRQASSRYQTKVAVTLLLRPVENMRWQAEWNLLPATGAPMTWQTEAESIAELLEKGGGLLGKKLVRRFDHSGSSRVQTATQLRIDSVRTLEQYAQLTRYLEQIPQLKSLRLLMNSNDSLLLEASILGGSLQLSRFIGIGSQLEALPATSSAKVIHYRYNDLPSVAPLP